MKFALSLTSVVLSFAAAAHAAPIVISNPSFESPDVPDGTQVAQTPGWTVQSGSVVTRDNTPVDMPGAFSPATHGSQVSYFTGGGELRLALLGYKIQANNTWQVSADLIGVNPADMAFGFLQLATVEDPLNFLPAANNGVLTTGSLGWQTATFSISIAANEPRIGQTPMIVLKQNAGFGALYWDNVRGETNAVFDPTQVPEPTSLSACIGAMALLRRRR